MASTTSVSGPGQNFVARVRNASGNVPHERNCLLDGIDQDRKGLVLRAALYLEDALDGGEVEGIGGEAIKGVCGNGDDTSALDEVCGVVNYVALRRIW